jgi:hypothetical protein
VANSVNLPNKQSRETPRESQGKGNPFHKPPGELKGKATEVALAETTEQKMLAILEEIGKLLGRILTESKETNARLKDI